MTESTESIEQNDVQAETANVESTPASEVEKVEVEQTPEVEKSETTQAPETKEEGIKFTALIAEFLGTFFLAAVVIKMAQAGTEGAIAISLALVLLIMVFGAMSGAQMNPAISIALLINRKMGALKTICYIVAQVLGGAVALLVMHALYKAGYDQTLAAALTSKAGVSAADIAKQGGASKYLDYMVQQYAASGQSVTKDTLLQNLGVTSFISVTIAKGAAVMTFFSEVLGSIIFGLGVGHAVIAEDKTMVETGMAVGFGLLGGLLIGGSVVILNPAVGVAIGAFSHPSSLAAALLIYVVGTIIGMTIGITVYRFLRERALAK